MESELGLGLLEGIHQRGFLKQMMLYFSGNQAVTQI
jgi:hypothetical protein